MYVTLKQNHKLSLVPASQIQGLHILSFYYPKVSVYSGCLASDEHLCCTMFY